MAKKPNGNGKVTSVFLALDGSPAKTDAQIVESYREECKQTGTPLDDLTDEEVLETVRAIPGVESEDDTSVRDKRIEALQELQSEREDVTETTPSAMSEHIQEAVEAASAIAETADKWMETGADANETRIGAPVHLALDLMRDYADEWESEFAENGLPIRCPYVLQLPIPGSSSEDKVGTWGGENFNNFDIVKVKGGTERYYRTMSDTIGAGVQLLRDILDLELMGSKGYVPGSARNKALVERYEADEEGRKSKLAQLKTRRNQRASVLARAIGLIQTWTRLNDEFDGEYFDWKFVEAFTMDPEENVKIFDEICRRGKPFQLVSIGNKKKGLQGGDTDAFGLTQMLSLQHPSPIDSVIRINRAKALMGGEPSKAAAKLRQVMKERQEAGEGSNQGGGTDTLGGAVPLAPKPEFMEAVFSQTVNGFDVQQVGKANADLYRAKFLTFYNQSGPEADKRLETFKEAIAFYNDILAQYTGRLNRIADEQAKRSAA